MSGSASNTRPQLLTVLVDGGFSIELVFDEPNVEEATVSFISRPDS